MGWDGTDEAMMGINGISCFGMFIRYLFVLLFHGFFSLFSLSHRSVGAEIFVNRWRR